MSGFMEALLGLTTFRCLVFGHKWEYRSDRKEHLCSRCMEKPPIPEGSNKPRKGK